MQSIGAIVEAGLRALWRGPAAKFPEGNGRTPWEIWLDVSQAEEFIARAAEFDVAIGTDRLEFPEDLVVIANATRDSLALAVRRLGSVRALAAPNVTAEYFDAMQIEEQIEWLGALQGLTTFEPIDDPAYITLLDRGVGLSHPLISPALNAADRHAAELAWA